MRKRLTDSASFEMFEDFRCNDVFDAGDRAALFFEAGVGDRTVQGVDCLTLRSGGLMANLTVMIRPLSGLNAVAEHMGQRLAQPYNGKTYTRWADSLNR